METAAIGIDLGATKIAAALVAASGQVLVSRTIPTQPSEGQQAVIGRLAGLVNDFSLIARSMNLELLGVGIGTPGLVDPQAGIVHNAVNLGWLDVPLKDELKRGLDLPLPVWVQKDGNASAIGEFVFGAAQGCPDFLYLSIGTGLGGGLFAAGQLISGACGNATELGHISLDPEGRSCVCGLKGCAETVLSGQGLLALYHRLAAAEKVPVMPYIEDATPAGIIQAALEGKAPALACMAEMGRQLGIVIAFCAAVTNPALVVIGGGLGLAIYDLLVPRARLELERRVLKATHAGLRIAPSLQQSSALGAASLAWYFTKRR